MRVSNAVQAGQRIVGRHRQCGGALLALPSSYVIGRSEFLIPFTVCAICDNVGRQPRPVPPFDQDER